MARLTSSPVPLACLQQQSNSCEYNTSHKTSPSSTDTACSQDEPLELTVSHGRAPPAACTSLHAPAAVMPQLPLTLHVADTLRSDAPARRVDGRGHETLPAPAPTSVLLSAYCDATVLMQTGAFDSSHLTPVSVHSNQRDNFSIT